MRAQDLDVLAQLYLRAYGVSWNERGARSYIEKFFNFEPASCLVVVDGDTPMGAIMGFSFEKESGLVLFIQELFVDPVHRDRGAGKRLVAALREAVAPNSVKIKPLVKADTSVLNFYNSLGFEEDIAVHFSFDE